jgi:hypothetical protein
MTSIALNPRVCLRRLAAFAWLLAMSFCVQAQWSTTTLDNTVNSPVDLGARVINENGASLQIYQNSDLQLVSEFKLGQGLVRLDPITCPTLQIDRVEPEDFNNSQHQCVVNGDSALFKLTQISEGQVDSKTFLELMNGSQLVIRYRLLGAGYGQQKFSLKGSKQILKATLTQGTVVLGD